nr:cold shock domain-containing protein [Mycobacterium ahvazicum]
MDARALGRGNQRVQFEVNQGPKGPKAVQVTAV